MTPVAKALNVDETTVRRDAATNVAYAPKNSSENNAAVDLSRLTFVFAKTMPETPHEYVVRTPDNEADYMALFRAVQQHGKDERFQKRRYRYWYPGDGWKYWAMTTDERTSRILNRAKVDDAEGGLGFR